MVKKLLVAIISITLLAGCATQMRVTKNAANFKINSIALMPNGGILADAIGMELLGYGYNIVDTAIITSVMVRNNLNEAEIMLPVNLLKLKEQGIDAILNVRTVGGYDGKPQSVSFRLVFTENGFVIVGGSWNNASAGAQGSIADARARRDLNEAAEEIARGISEAIGDNRR